ERLAVNTLSELHAVTLTTCRPDYRRLAADAERSTSAPSCCQGGGPHHARLRLRVAAVPLRTLDSGRCVAAREVSATEECRSLSHQRNAGGDGGRVPSCPSLPSLDPVEALKSLPLVGDDRCRKRVSIHEGRGIQRNVELQT